MLKQLQLRCEGCRNQRDLQQMRCSEIPEVQVQSQNPGASTFEPAEIIQINDTRRKEGNSRFRVRVATALRLSCGALAVLLRCMILVRSVTKLLGGCGLVTLLSSQQVLPATGALHHESGVVRSPSSLAVPTFPKLPEAMATTNAPAPAAVAPVASVPRGQVDLVDFIDWSGVECLNQDASHNIANALKQGYRDDEGLYLASDSDEQLLIHIPFMQVVKLHSALFKGPEEEGPKTVKLFSNKEHMGFSNVNDYPPSDSLDLSADHLVESKPVMLKYVKFQNVRSLTIFVEDNQSESDVSKIQKIALYGTTVDTTNMKDLKKIEEH